jgi:2-methylisocitrate lyase-like PEP mutase family enzyme
MGIGIMSLDTKAKRKAFRALHETGCFVLPNPWDAGSAVQLARMGFKALASTSAGFAWTLGRDDGEVTRDELLAHLRVLNEATDLPVNADFEAGFADDPNGVATNVRLAVGAGVAGLSIEDRTGTALYPLETAVARIRAAHAGIAETGEDVVLVGRSEGFLIGHRDLSATIARLKAYADAGADCLYAPGVTDPEAIKAIVAAVAPKPVNVLLMNSTMKVPDLAALGVRRVSTGGGLAHAAWAGFEAAAHGLIETGAVPDRK